jgi:hypothetical protein
MQAGLLKRGIETMRVQAPAGARHVIGRDQFTATVVCTLWGHLFRLC